MAHNEIQKPLDTKTFIRIRKWYLLALAAIALSIILAQVLIQSHLNSQLDDSRVINVAGRQRAFSQKLVKEVLLLKRMSTPAEKERILPEIINTLSVWKASHKGLQSGDKTMSLPVEEDPEILDMFRNIDPHYSAMAAAADRIVQSAAAEVNLPAEDMEDQITILLDHERSFLSMMDHIVNVYDQRSKEQLQNLKQKEMLLMTFSLMILLLEMLFIFRPLAIQIRNTIGNLLRNQEQSDASAKEIQRLFAEKERSMKELQELNFVIDNATLFASLRKDGTVVSISKKFVQLLHLAESQLNKHLSEILTTDEGQQEYLRQLLKGNRKNVIRNEEINISTSTGGQFWLDMSIVPMLQSGTQQSILILCTDITERKRQLQKVEQLKQQNFEERMLEKKMQAGQIVEGQEEERKRIAKDIHDGIGQMLTALKFNIESIDTGSPEKTAEKIAYLKSLTTDLIKGVRTATFNLMPPELDDHGIFPALQKMTAELSKLTGKTILFENKIKENIRFDSLAETNIYRVSQEAVNNAIKYAKAKHILVTINFNDDILSVVIDDDGKGFDPSIIQKAPKNSSDGGMGLFFMKERIGYINGRLFISSSPGKGTRVTINYKTTT